jgi:hypothetical protein
MRQRPVRGGTQDMMARDMVATRGAPGVKAEGRLPWILAVPLIGGLSVGLWLVFWEIAQLAFAG